jgi:hypothetical protein
MQDAVPGSDGNRNAFNTSRFGMKYACFDCVVAYAPTSLNMAPGARMKALNKIETHKWNSGAYGATRSQPIAKASARDAVAVGKLQDREEPRRWRHKIIRSFALRTAACEA